MIEINIKKKKKFGKQVRILECDDLPAILALVSKHYDKDGGWIVTRQPERSGILKKYYRVELMKRF